MRWIPGWKMEQAMTTQTTLEKVARAICVAHYSGEHEDGWPEFVDHARAALQALREPTEELVDVIYHTETDVGRFKNLVLIPRGDLIDAALQEKG